jgi:hypothetical protein
MGSEVSPRRRKRDDQRDQTAVEREKNDLRVEGLDVREEAIRRPFVLEAVSGVRRPAGVSHVYSDNVAPLETVA